ncbi:deoxyribonuclease V [Leptolyngbya sp. NK1-12]|uniref:Endonuclease V n=2 Tax=Leptolyngbya sp. NK1-12 TaxID=2547451 RepID=A0AA96WJ77_9CYAN|nr:deoxyribonuclease V [Leptolyngbya sp. NK1-12]
MEIQHQHDWNLTPEAAVALQQSLRQAIITIDQFDEVQTVAGVDVGFEDAGETTRAAVAVLSFPQLQVIEQAVARRPTSFPYVPGLLSFREVPAVLEALAKLKQLPDLLLCDGQGTAHPRRFGIACHIGLLTNLPAIGVGKSLLVGTHPAVPDEKGAWVPLKHKGETIGAVVRTRVGTKPLFISPGHRISLATAIEYVMRCTTKYRLPETTRQAHNLASETPAAVIDAVIADQQLRLNL